MAWITCADTWTRSRTRHRSHVLTLPYDEVLALYFENRRFGFCFLQLASDRLLKDKARAEDGLAAERVASLQMRGDIQPGAQLNTP